MLELFGMGVLVGAGVTVGKQGVDWLKKTLFIKAVKFVKEKIDNAMNSVDEEDDE